MRRIPRMDDPELSPAALYDAVMILAEGRVMADGQSVLKRWRRACEWLIRHRGASESATILVRGVFAHGRKLRT